MDRLEQMIMQKRAEVESLRSRIAVLEAEVAALELADKLRPATAPRAEQQSEATRGRSGGGRRPGDISQVWRGILRGVHELNRPVDYEAVEKVARAQGHKLEASSIRDRVRNLVKTGLMSGNAAEGFTVTQDAVERFDFAAENVGAAASTEARAEEDVSLFGPHSPNSAHRGA